MKHFIITATSYKSATKLKRWRHKIKDPRMIFSILSIDPYIIKLEGRGALLFAMKTFKSKQIEQCEALLSQGLINSGLKINEYKIEAVL